MLQLNFSNSNFQKLSPYKKIIWLTTTTLPCAITEDCKMSTSSSRTSLERHLDMTVIQMFPYSVLYLAVRWKRWWQTNITYINVGSEETRSATQVSQSNWERGMNYCNNYEHWLKVTMPLQENFTTNFFLKMLLVLQPNTVVSATIHCIS